MPQSVLLCGIEADYSVFSIYLSKINKIDEDEISDIMAEYDFLVDASQYGTGAEMAKSISKEEYEVLKNVHQ